MERVNEAALDPHAGGTGEAEQSGIGESIVITTEPIKFSRAWAMPSADTFSIAPIETFVQKYLAASKVSVDPFARNKRWATYTNDLNPNTAAEYHMDAEAFVLMLCKRGVLADLVLFDPPYSPRQISECYKGIGISVGFEETQNSALVKRVRMAVAKLCGPGATVLSFGWNSVGMGDGHGFDLIEQMNVCHGGAHNDTICIAERKRPELWGAL